MSRIEELSKEDASVISKELGLKDKLYDRLVERIAMIRTESMLEGMELAMRLMEGENSGTTT
jgi:hypothetical protein